MARVGFVLKVKQDRLEEYRERHAVVWPDMLDALRRSGWHNYSLFLRSDGTLFGYFEAAISFTDSLDAMAGEEVNDRWQREMAPFFERAGDGGGPRADEMMEELVEVFHLD